MKTKIIITIKKMKKYIIMLTLLAAICSCSSDEDDERDMLYPEITDEGIVASPTDCQVYTRGETLPFNYLFKDNVELGSYNIEIHNNFDHHTHSTSSVECPMDAQKTPVTPWIYNADFTIPPGQRSYTSRIDIAIPSDIDPGDYHFMVRLTDKAGWQQLRAMAIKIK